MEESCEFDGRDPGRLEELTVPLEPNPGVLTLVKIFSTDKR